MYRTSKDYHQLFSHFLAAEQQSRAIELVKIDDAYFSEYLKLSEDKCSSGFSLRAMPTHEMEALGRKYNIKAIEEEIRSLSEIAFNNYMQQTSVKAIPNVKDAFIQIIKQILRINLWEEDVEAHKKDLQSRGLDKYSTPAAKNYWYYMEWRNDFINMSYPLFTLLGNKIPDELITNDVDVINYADALWNHCGYNPILTRENLMFTVKSALKTSYDWKNQTDSWILKGYANTNQRYFDEQVDFLVAFYKMLESMDDFNHPEDSDVYLVDEMLTASAKKTQQTKELLNIDDVLSLLREDIYKIIDLKKSSDNIQLRNPENRGWFLNRLSEKVSSLGVVFAHLLQRKPKNKFALDKALLDKIFTDIKQEGLPLKYYEYKNNVRRYLSREFSEILLMQRSVFTEEQKSIYLDIWAMYEFFKDDEIEIDYKKISHLIEFKFEDDVEEED